MWVMKEYGGVEVCSTLISALYGGEWSASFPDRFHPKKEPMVPTVPLYRRTGGPQNRSGRDVE